MRPRSPMRWRVCRSRTSSASRRRCARTTTELIGEYFVGLFKKGVKYDAENTGFGWATAVTVLAKDIDQPNTCKMKRPKI